MKVVNYLTSISFPGVCCKQSKNVITRTTDSYTYNTCDHACPLITN